MLASEQMRWGARCMAAIFGGPGVFFAWLSFSEPREAMTAIIYLVIATALLFAAEEPVERPGGRGGMLQRCVVRATRRRRP